MVCVLAGERKVRRKRSGSASLLGVAGLSGRIRSATACLAPLIALERPHSCCRRSFSAKVPLEEWQRQVRGRGKGLKMKPTEQRLCDAHEIRGVISSMARKLAEADRRGSRCISSEFARGECPWPSGWRRKCGFCSTGKSRWGG